MRGNQCVYVCADDTHGTATMLKAEQRRRAGRDADRSASAIDTRARCSHASSSVRQLLLHALPGKPASCARRSATRLSEGGYIFDARRRRSCYDPERKMFLADRFVKGDAARNCAVAGSIRRQLRSVRRDVRRDRPQATRRSLISGDDAGPARDRNTTSSTYRSSAGMLTQSGLQGTCKRRGRQQTRRMARRQSASRGTSRRDAPYFGF